MELKQQLVRRAPKTKDTKQPVKSGFVKGSPGWTIHTDVCGPLKEPTIGGKHQFVTLF